MLRVHEKKKQKTHKHKKKQEFTNCNSTKHGCDTMCVYSLTKYYWYWYLRGASAWRLPGRPEAPPAKTPLSLLFLTAIPADNVLRMWRALVNYTTLLCTMMNLISFVRKKEKNNILCRKCKPLIRSLWNRPQVILAGCWNLFLYTNVRNVHYACGCVKLLFGTNNL